MIFTSYFSLTKKLEQNGYTTISISRFPPKFYDGKKAFGLAPSESILNRYKTNQINEDEYTKEYIEYLESRREELVPYLTKLYNSDKKYVFLCYEKAGDFCHRRILADWFKEKTGFECTEIDKEKI